MPNVEPIKVLNIDEQAYAVEGMSDDIKALVNIFNEWNQKEADAADALAMIRAAKNDLSRQIIMSVRAEQEEKTEEAPEVEDEAVPAANDVDGE